MNQHELRQRTKQFAIQILRLCSKRPSDWDVRELGKQLLRCGTAVAANYRACGRARSAKEFCSRLAIVVEEADESQLWLELLLETHPAIKSDSYALLQSEAGQLTAIFTTSYRTARRNLKDRRVEHEKGRAR